MQRCITFGHLHLFGAAFIALSGYPRLVGCWLDMLGCIFTDLWKLLFIQWRKVRGPSSQYTVSLVFSVLTVKILFSPPSLWQVDNRNPFWNESLAFLNKRKDWEYIQIWEHVQHQLQEHRLWEKWMLCLAVAFSFPVLKQRVPSPFVSFGGGNL